jgi:TolA-binding protein
MKFHSLAAATLATFCLLQTGCLKTRAQLSGEPADEANANRPVPAQIQEVQPQGQYVIDEVKSEITRLNGRIEDLERGHKSGETASADIKKLEGRIAELETAQAQMIEAIKKMQEAPAAAPTAEAGDAFEKAKKQFESQDLEGAIQNLNLYLKNPKAKHAEDAVFLRGESHFQSKEFKKAIVDFSKFPEKYTKSKRMPHALMRIGQSFDALGMKEDAKGFYAELYEKFPKSPEAKRARGKARP